MAAAAGRAYRWLALTCSLCSVLLLLHRGARADEEQVHLSYQAGAGCRDAAAFVAEVAARTPKARWVERSEGMRVFEIALRVEPSPPTIAARRATGDLTIHDPKGGVFHRELRGASCDEVLSAMALVTALAIDPHASIERYDPVTELWQLIKPPGSG